MSRDEKQRVRAVREAMRRVLPPNEHLRLICQRTLEAASGARSCSISFVGQKTVRVGVVVGASEARDYEGREVPHRNTYCAAVVKINAPIYAPRVDDQPLLATCLVSRDAFPGYAGYPVQFRGLVVGALAVTADADTLAPDVLNVLAREANQIEELMRSADQ